MDTDSLARLAETALPLWDLPKGVDIRLINLSENATFLVSDTAGFKSVLRVHRPGYHSFRAIECELAWMAALDQEGVIRTPRAIPARDGAYIQTVSSTDGADPVFLVLFDFIHGVAPASSDDMEGLFEELGRIAAKCHQHALGWSRPAPFERLIWSAETVFGPDATWGDWRSAPGVTEGITDDLEAVERSIVKRLNAYGTSPDRFNLIHADMRFANLLIEGGETRLIDFDDCGMGWLMYDFAAAVSFIEDDPRLPRFKAAWLNGYQAIRPLTKADIDEIDTLVMLRRMALLAWIGSHIEAPEPQALAPHFAANTARLGRAWLAGL